MPGSYWPRYILVHHSAANDPSPQFDAIDEWHRARAFARSTLGYYVGYHRVIEKDGTVRVARVDLERDCDALGHNFDSLSVCLVGELDTSDPTPEQVASLGAVLDEWCTKYNLTANDIFPHRHFANKTCYGLRLLDNWAALVYLRHALKRIQGKLAEIEASRTP